MKLNITYDSDPKHHDTQVLWAGISRHPSLMRNQEPGKPFAFFVRDELNQIHGGCSGFIFYGCCYIDLLWVETKMRGKSYGKELINSVEQLATKDNCNFIAVNTMDWEALDFYKQLGFYVEFERKGFDKDSILYFLRKNLS